MVFCDNLHMGLESSFEGPFVYIVSVMGLPLIQWTHTIMLCFVKYLVCHDSKQALITMKINPCWSNSPTETSHEVPVMMTSLWKKLDFTLNQIK